MSETPSTEPDTPEPASEARESEVESKSAQEVAAYLADGLKRLEEAREDVPGVVSYGASNYPHDPSVWAADWRESLPPKDPLRHDRAHPIVKNGTLQAYKTMKAAHQAIRRAYGLSTQDSKHP